MTPAILCTARNAQQSKHSATALGLNLVLSGDGQAPEWIELIPAGRDVQGVDGRAWINDKPEGIVAAFNAGGRPLPIDQDHALDLAATQGRPAPAAGWIEELQMRQGGSIWGRVSWTPPGAELVQNRQYRFISPAFLYERNSTRILRLASAALTNQPNLRMTALNAAGSSAPSAETETAMLEKLLALLGLDKTTTEEQALTAVDKYVPCASCVSKRISSESVVVFLIGFSK